MIQDFLTYLLVIFSAATFIFLLTRKEDKCEGCNGMK